MRASYRARTTLIGSFANLARALRSPMKTSDLEIIRLAGRRPRRSCLGPALVVAMAVFILLIMATAPVAFTAVSVRTMSAHMSAVEEAVLPAMSVLNVSSWRGKRVMAIVAHPDDAEMYCGGTLFAAAQHGANTSLVIVTNGDKGGQCYNATGARFPCGAAALAATRAREAACGAAVLMMHEHPRILGFQDAGTPDVPEVELRERITAEVRRFRPHVVLTHDPRPDFEATPANLGPDRGAPKRYGNLGYAPDHQRVGQVVLDTIVGPTSRHDNILPQLAAEGLHGWTADEFYMFALTRHRITRRTALDAATVDAKERAFECHHSQYTNATALREYVRWVGQAIARAGPTSVVPAYGAAGGGVPPLMEGFKAYF